MKVGIPESFNVGWYPPQKVGRVTLNRENKREFKYGRFLNLLTQWNGYQFKITSCLVALNKYLFVLIWLIGIHRALLKSPSQVSRFMHLSSEFSSSIQREAQNSKSTSSNKAAQTILNSLAHEGSSVL